MDGYITILTVNIVITILFRLAYSLRYKEKLCVIFCAYAIYIVCAVCRVIGPGVGGTDAYTYYGIYRQADCSFFDYLTALSNEPVYLTVNWIAKNWVGNYGFALWIFHSIAFLFTSYFLMHVKAKRNNLVTWMGTFLVVGNLFFMFSMLRNSLAICIISVAVLKLREEKFGISFLFILFALSIHYSVIIFLMFWALLYVMHRGWIQSEKKILGLFIICYALVWAAMDFLQGIINRKYEFYFVEGSNTIVAVRSYVIIGIALFLSKGVWDKVKEKQLGTVAVMLLFSLILSIINMRYTIVYRMVYDILPMFYMYFMELLDDSFVIKRRYRPGELLFGGFAAVYLLYRCYALVSIEYVTIFPYISTIWAS